MLNSRHPFILATALAAKPDYVALGPIYETRLKVMKWAPQGLDRLGDWKSRIGDLPLVAIGGITPQRADGVLAAGADSVAVITDFFTHPDPPAHGRLLGPVFGKVLGRMSQGGAGCPSDHRL